MTGMTPDEVRDIVKQTVAEVLTTMGIEVDDPRKMQADFLHLRKGRLGSIQIATWTKRSAVSAAMGGLVWAVWYGFKAGVGK